YVVKGSDGNYYEADIDSDTGNVSWDSSTAAVAAADVDETTSLNEIVTSTSNEAAVTGLASNESLHEVKDADGNVTGYVVKGEDSYGNVTYNAADVEVNASNEAVVTKGEAKTVDALGTLDSALKTVDALRSDLGAIQNRFESAITNLSTTETNLSAAKSRIEDADYATEVANMTRSQILQQAGTSVLAQANQLPQSVLSLLG
ncbi:flagellin, partial [Halomonas sp. BBD48]|nr:flagellin [Halomonas sp. BBD48]